MNIPIEIVVTVVGAFLSILGFGFLVIWQNTKAINALSLTLVELNTKDRMTEKESSDKHIVIDKRLNEHSAKINAHGIVLVEHEVKIKNLEK